MRSRNNLYMAFILGVLCVLFLLTGCQKKDERRNLGVDDGIESFVYNFDPREEVALLVKNVKAGKFPEEISWHYDTNKGPQKKKYSVLKKTTDPDIIKEIYYALGDTIIVGISNNQNPVIDIDLTFTLSGGEICVFNFVSENTIRISGQNYVLEADGKLWKLLRSEEVETELEELLEAESEDLSEAADEELTEALPETVYENEETEGTEEISEAADEELTEAADEELTEAADEELTEAADEELTEAQTETN